MKQWIVEQENSVLLKVYVQPGASKTEISGEYGLPARLKIRLSAPPIDGKANKELTRFLAKLLKVPKTNIVLIRGHASKSKDLIISGVSDISEILNLLSIF